MSGLAYARKLVCREFSACFKSHSNSPYGQPSASPGGGNLEKTVLLNSLLSFWVLISLSRQTLSSVLIVRPKLPKCTNAKFLVYGCAMFSLSHPGRKTASFKTHCRITNLFIASCLVGGGKERSQFPDGTQQGSEDQVRTFASGNCM